MAWIKTRSPILPRKRFRSVWVCKSSFRNFNGYGNYEPYGTNVDNGKGFIKTSEKLSTKPAFGSRSSLGSRWDFAEKSLNQTVIVSLNGHTAYLRRLHNAEVVSSLGMGGNRQAAPAAIYFCVLNVSGAVLWLISKMLITKSRPAKHLMNWLAYLLTWAPPPFHQRLLIIIPVMPRNICVNLGGWFRMQNLRWLLR